MFPLPVELVSFSAFVKVNSVVLNWRTATEVNNYGFDVERKLINSDWTKIGFVQGHGNSNSPKSYSFADVSPISGIVNYRLKQIDFDGKYEYSPIVEVNVETPLNFALAQNYPNPFNPTTRIKYDLASQSHVNVQVYDVLGQKVSELINEVQQPGVYDVKFDGSHLSSGVYLLVFQAGAPSSGSGQSFVKTQKMILMK